MVCKKFQNPSFPKKSEILSQYVVWLNSSIHFWSHPFIAIIYCIIIIAFSRCYIFMKIML